MENFVNWMGSTTLAVSVLILLVMLLRRPVARYFGAGFAYALWALPVLRMVLPDMNILPQKIDTLSPPILENLLRPESVDLMAIDVLPQVLSSTTMWSPYLWISAVWVVGICLYLTVQMGRQIAFHRRLVRQSWPANADFILTLKQLSEDLNMRRIPRVVMMSDMSLMVVGLFKPVLIIPESFAQNYTPAEQRLVLAHEMLHLKRKDLWAHAICLIFTALNWFNPLAYLARRGLEVDQEAACDAAVMRHIQGPDVARTYANALFKTTQNPTTSVLLLLSFGSHVKTRIQLLISARKSKTRRRVGRGAIAVIMTTALFGTAQYGFAKNESRHVTSPAFEFVHMGGEETFEIVSFISSNGSPDAVKLQSLRETSENMCPILPREGPSRHVLGWSANTKKDKNNNWKNSGYYLCLNGDAANNNGLKDSVARRMIYDIEQSEHKDHELVKDTTKALERFIASIPPTPLGQSTIALDDQEVGELLKGGVSVNVSISSGNESLLSFPIGKEDFVTLDDNSPPHSVDIYECGDTAKMSIWIWEDGTSDTFIPRQVICLAKIEFNDLEQQKRFLSIALPAMYKHHPSLTEAHKAALTQDLKTKVNSL